MNAQNELCQRSSLSSVLIRAMLFAIMLFWPASTARGQTCEHWSRAAGDHPVGRFLHAMAYDSIRGVTVMFGGTDFDNPLGDTWEWDGKNWTLRSTSGPAPRENAAMA